MDFAEFIGANRHTIAIAQSYFGGVSVDIRFRLRLTGLPSTVAIGGFASAKQCHLKILTTLYNFWHRLIDITNFEKPLCFIVSRICFDRNCSPGLLWWSSLQTFGGKGEPNFISSGSKIIKRLWHRQYVLFITERTICLVLGPPAALYRP